MLDAVIFDFDGVIVDSERYHYRAYQDALKPHGHDFTWDDYVDYFIGFDDRDAFRAVYARLGHDIEDEHLRGLIAAKAKAFQRIIDREGATPYPGVVSLINALHKQGPVGLCSGALRSDVLPVLKRLELTGDLDVIVTAEDVASSKPDPECYALCLRKLTGHFPERTIRAGHAVAIEDTPAGIAAARGAGLRVLAVTNSYSKDRLRAADVTVDSLADMTPDHLNRLFTTE